MPYATIIIGLIVLVTLHELGHFLAARAVGIRVTKFYLFFPPAVFKKKIGDVEYGIGALPLGGFVKLPGMFEPVPREVAERVRWELEEITPRVDDGDLKLRLDASTRQMRSVTLVERLAEPLRELDESLAAAATGTSDADLRKRIAKARERITGMLDDVHPKAYWRAALWRRMVVIFAGPLMNLVIALVVLTAFWWQLVPHYEITGPAKGVPTKASPAADAGLTKGSKVIEWNGPIKGLTVTEFGERIADSRGKPIKAVWLNSDGDRISKTIVPEQLDAKDPTKLIGFGFNDIERDRVGYEDISFGRGAHLAVIEMKDITWGNIKGIGKVAVSSKAREQVGSVVGIVQFADEVDRNDLTVRYIGLISLVLAVMNLLPLLPLDGGHLLFGVLEKARRGRVMPRVAFERYSLIGIALVLLLFFIGLDNDLSRSSG